MNTLKTTKGTRMMSPVVQYFKQLLASVTIEVEVAKKLYYNNDLSNLKEQII